MTASAQDRAKLAAARHALTFIEPGMIVGLGSGTTATLFIEHLGERVKQGLSVRGIATSISSEKLARQYDIPIIDFTQTASIDVAIDGADEVAPGLALIKGGGGNLLREKIVASAAKRFIIVVDASKIVQQLGAFPLPIEVIQMAAPLVEPKLRSLGLEPQIRKAKDGQGPYITDEGNYILDCRSSGFKNPLELAAELDRIVGLVEHGFFLGMAERVIIADGEQVKERTAADFSS